MPDGKIRVHCPACGAAARALESITQQERECPKCGKTVCFTPVDDLETGPLPGEVKVPVLQEKPAGGKDRNGLLLGIGIAVLVVIIAGIAVSMTGKPEQTGPGQSRASEEKTGRQPAPAPEPHSQPEPEPDPYAPDPNDPLGTDLLYNAKMSIALDGNAIKVWYKGETVVVKLHGIKGVNRIESDTFNGFDLETGAADQIEEWIPTGTKLFLRFPDGPQKDGAGEYRAEIWRYVPGLQRQAGKKYGSTIACMNFCLNEYLIMYGYARMDLEKPLLDSNVSLLGMARQDPCGVWQDSAATARFLNRYYPWYAARNPGYPERTPRTLIITGVNGKGTAPNGADEYAEIENITAAPIPMQGWTLTSSERRVFTFPEDGTFAPGRKYRVYTNQEHAEWGGFSFKSDNDIFSDSGSFASAQLKYPDGSYTESFRYLRRPGSSRPTVEAKISKHALPETLDEMSPRDMHTQGLICLRFPVAVQVDVPPEAKARMQTWVAGLIDNVFGVALPDEKYIHPLMADLARDTWEIGQPGTEGRLRFGEWVSVRTEPVDPSRYLSFSNYSRIARHGDSPPAMARSQSEVLSEEEGFKIAETLFKKYIPEATDQTFYTVRRYHQEKKGNRAYPSIGHEDSYRYNWNRRGPEGMRMTAWNLFQVDLYRKTGIAKGVSIMTRLPDKRLLKKIIPREEIIATVREYYSQAEPDHLTLASDYYCGDMVLEWRYNAYTFRKPDLEGNNMFKYGRLLEYRTWDALTGLLRKECKPDPHFGRLGIRYNPELFPHRTAEQLKAHWEAKLAE